MYTELWLQHFGYEFSHLMNITLSMYNISSYHFNRRAQHRIPGKLFEEVFWTQFLLDE